MAEGPSLDAIPRCGWVESPSAVTPLPSLAEELGLAWLGAKRDDLIPALGGGTKVRKLDVLLAAPPWRDSAEWSSVGAIGSGHLLALAEAARLLDRHLVADAFFEPPCDEVRDNLAHLAAGPVSIRFHGSRWSLAFRRAVALLGLSGPGFVPPGATTLEGVLGVARGGFELAEQVRAGEIPPPDDVVVAAGTGGTVAGLAVGLALGGLMPTIRAVSVVETPLLPEWRLHQLARRAAHALGLDRYAPIRVVRGHVGPGYGQESEASRQAVSRLATFGIPLDPIYSGKAFGALAELGVKGRVVLFWVTCHRSLPAVGHEWLATLPAPLVARLDAPHQGSPAAKAG